MYRKILLSISLVLVGFSSSVAQVSPFSKINSSYDEQNPVLSPDGQRLFFTRSHDPSNVGGERDPGDIWYSELTPTGWSAPFRAPSINSYTWNGVIDFTADGDLLLHNHYAIDGVLKTQGIAMAEKAGDSWKAPQNIRIPYYKNTSDYFGGSLSSNGSIMVLALESYGTVGAEDLYIMFKRQGEWTEPRNMGRVLNTAFQELTPFIYKDSVLYFSSNGHAGEGSTDVFVSRRLDDSWMAWGPPVNVEEINTEGRELGYRQYDGFAIYTSTLNSDGYGDLKLYTEGDMDSVFNQELTAQSDSLLITESDGQRGGVLLHGSISSASPDIKVKPQVKVEGASDEAKVEVNYQKNEYNVYIDTPGQYVVTVAAPGFIAEQEKIELTTANKQDMVLNFILKPVAVGTRVNLKNVLFEQSKAVIIDSSYPQLNLVVELMRQNPSMKIMLEGHTDNRGVAKHNVRLSQDRVEAVEAYLISKGIAGNRIKGKGYGGARPIADNSDPEARKLNRRVEFLIIKE